MQDYVNTYPGCDAFIEYVASSGKLIRVFVCAGSMAANDELVRVRCTEPQYSKYIFLNISSMFEMGDISSVFSL